MTKGRILLIAACVAGAALCALWFCRPGPKPSAGDSPALSRPPVIRPDYRGVMMPPNIAPLNFVVREPGTDYFVRIRAGNGEPIEVSSRTGQIRIPLRPWKALLHANRAGRLALDVYVRNKEGQWRQYETITNTIAQEPIDSHIAYRLIKPLHNFWKNVGVYQRNLETCHESIVLHGKSFEAGLRKHTLHYEGCVNCHSFLNNDPEQMFIGIRSPVHGSSVVLARDEQVDKIPTKFGYTAWHPSGRLAAYSLNKVHIFFRASGMEVRDVIDFDSALAYYNIDTQTIGTAPGISNKQRLETYPAWSPDGRYLYYSSAPATKRWFASVDRSIIPLASYKRLKYDLMRISYDLETDKWGKPETVVSSRKTRLSALIPRISPDGRFLLFCMCKYGCFPVYQPSSDLYLLDLKTGKYHKPAINSKFSESWHSWSSNSRWIAFSSKRRGGMFTRIYFSYVDQNGKAYKPFIMPQKDPTFDDAFLCTYSVPELITGPITVSQTAFVRAIHSDSQSPLANPVTGATPKAKTSQPYQDRE